MEFESKSLMCALNLLPNDSELIIKFYQEFIMLDIPEKEKCFAIKLSAKKSQEQ